MALPDWPWPTNFFSLFNFYETRNDTGIITKIFSFFFCRLCTEFFFIENRLSSYRWGKQDQINKIRQMSDVRRASSPSPYRGGGITSVLNFNIAIKFIKFAWNFCASIMFSKIIICFGYDSFHDYAPAPSVWGIKRWCASDVCLSVCLTSDVCLSRTSGLSREPRGLERLKLAQR